jgi:hypothetical protein
MSELDKLISTIESLLSDSMTTDSVVETERLISKVIEFAGVDAVVPLLCCLKDDNCNHLLMFSIIHSVEIFDDKIYVQKVLEAIQVMYCKSIYWTSIIFMRILNLESARYELIRQSRETSNEVKAIIKGIMEQVNARNPIFMAKTIPVLLTVS